MRGRILGIDIGATTVKFAALEADGTLADRGVLPVASTDNAAFIDQLVSIVARPEFADCDRVGIGSPGPLDLDSGTIIASANMPGVKDLKLVAELKNRYPPARIQVRKRCERCDVG
jgi:glucokinase